MFVHPEGTNPSVACTATNDISFVCDSDGTWDLNSHDGTCGATTYDTNSVNDIEKDECMASDGDTWWMKASFDPCAPPGSSGVIALSAALATIIGVAMILA